MCCEFRFEQNFCKSVGDYKDIREDSYLRTGTGRIRVSDSLGVIQRSFTSRVRSTLSEFIHITEQQLSLDSPCCFARRDPLHRTI